ncbi:MAG: DUF4252 domain-containing protein [Dokdonia sp.]|jgi:hypothetical protein|nr:DNA topoisomerase IV [Cytophagaceae bacterium]
MKKVIVALAFVLSSIAVTAQSEFDKFEDVKGVQSLIMNQKMFKLLSKVDLNASDPEVQAYKELVDNLENIKMYTSSDAGVMSQMAGAMKSYLGKGKLQELMRATGDEGTAKFYYIPGKTDDYVSEFVMFLNGSVDGENRAVFFQLTGNIDLKQVSKLAQEFDFKGSDELKDVENAKKG